MSCEIRRSKICKICINSRSGEVFAIGAKINRRQEEQSGGVFKVDIFKVDIFKVDIFKLDKKCSPCVDKKWVESWGRQWRLLSMSTEK